MTDLLASLERHRRLGGDAAGQGEPARRTLPKVSGLVELPGARLRFRDERAGELVERHWHARPQAPPAPAREAA